MTTEQVTLAEQIAVVRRTIGNSEIAVKHYPDDMDYRKDVVILRAALASLSDLAAGNERIRQLDAENQGFMPRADGVRSGIMPAIEPASYETRWPLDNAASAAATPAGNGEIDG